ATCELRTAGEPAGLVLAADETSIAPTWDDIAYVRASVVDDHGTVVPNADNPIHFVITGPGVIVAVDSADNSSHEPFRGTKRRSYQGRCVAIVRALPSQSQTPIRVTAQSPELGEASVDLTVSPAPAAAGK